MQARPEINRRANERRPVGAKLAFSQSGVLAGAFMSRRSNERRPAGAKPGFCRGGVLAGVFMSR